MKNIEIKVSKTSRMVYLKNGNIGNDGENLQEKLVFSFQDKFVDGQARLEYEINGEKYFAILTKVGESYELPIKNVITKEGQVNMQLVITEGTDENEIPVFKSNVFYVVVNESINAESEEPDGYAQWLDIANTKLNSIDEVVLGVKEAVDYAKEQGDYAKEQADNVISASEKASEIIRDFEDDVEEYTSAFNQNVESKTTEFNTNATSKVKEYNENANSKVGEYNTNADNRINDFNQNADSYLDAIVPKNDASGVPIYVDDAVEYRVLNLDAKGNFKQDGTPTPDYPQEIEVIEGYNLFDKNVLVQGNMDITTGEEKASNYAVRTPYIDVSGGTNYTINGSYTGAGSFNISILQFASDNTFIEGKNENATFPNFITNENTRKIRITIYSDAGTKPTNFDELFPEFQLVKGTQKPYLPYQNVGYISVGENRFNSFAVATNNITTDTDGTLLVQGVTTTNGYVSTEKTLSQLCPTLKVGDKAYLYLESDFYEGDTTSPKDRIYIQNIAVSWYSKTSKIITQEMLNNNVVVYGGYNTTSHIKIMITKDTPASSYITPMQKLVPIDLKGNFVGKLPNGVADNLLYKDRHIYLEKNVRKVVLDGSEDWKEEGSINSLYRYNIRNLFFPTSRENAGISNYFKYEINYNGTEPHFYLNTNGNHYFFSYISTLAEFKQWLSENKPEVYYQLAEPQIIDLGEYDLSTLEGVNNISLLANIEPSEMNMTYAQNIKIYTDRTITQQIVGTLGGEY